MFIYISPHLDREEVTPMPVDLPIDDCCDDTCCSDACC